MFKNDESAVILDRVQQYDEFYRGWRQRLIENQFRVSRYFGANLSDNILNLKELEVPKLEDPSEPERCTMPESGKDMDMNKRAERIRCLVTVSAFWDRRQKAADPRDPEENFALGKMRSINTENIHPQMISHEASYVSILRGIDNRFFALGAQTVKVREP
ncbi:hypothetical protein VM99_21310 [Pseudomonas chlororaphis]|uniref:Uncharacterized protein n=1 Tax=Pseudomonas chlororaphis TaxID=587753 RepID=A0A0G3GLR8_9PSED|nr:hypothetical protein VM99_21310 [Pseudomonas chlororaphis]